MSRRSGRAVRTHAGPGPRDRAVTRASRLLALVAWLFAAAATAQELEIIELRHRLAEEVIPVVQPLVEPGGVLTGADRVLFVRASATNLEQIRRAVAVLDRPPRQLTVTVGQGTVSGSQAGGLRGSAGIGSGDVQVGVNAPPGAGTGVAAGAGSVVRQAEVADVASVRTLEGAETWIAVGKVVPLAGVQALPGPHGTRAYPYVEYRELSTGFYATVHLSGERVTLEISPRQQRLQATERGPVVATAGSTATVSGRLGEWIPLGAVRETGAGGSSGLLVWGRHSSTSEYTAWLRVDEVP